VAAATWDTAGAVDTAGTAGYDVLDCSCGIGTQAIGLALCGHRVAASDISAAAVVRAAREARARGAAPRVTAVADMRHLPFADSSFDAVVCADNSLPHLLTEEDVLPALSGMRRVLRRGGALALTVRAYDAILRERPVSITPQPSTLPDGRRTVTFQLWHWHEDGERYDLEHFQLLPDDRDFQLLPGNRGPSAPLALAQGLGAAGAEAGSGGWRVAVRRATYWALSRQRLTGLVLAAGFTDPRWDDPDGRDDRREQERRHDTPGRDDRAGRENRVGQDDRVTREDQDVADTADSSDPSESPGTPGFFQPVLTATAA
jgi:glycine/sarcosine N-methyltransferase